MEHFDHQVSYHRPISYSYDAVQFNQRVKTMVESTGVADLNKVGGPDLISNKYKDFNRGRVKPDIMQEIGFEDCDYISLELPWDTWTGIAQMWPLELHVPCRDPLDHLMSQCNHRKKEFDCDSNDIPGQVDDCLIGADRFDNSLIQMNHLTLKCFNPIPIEPYLEYMNRYLQKKRIQTSYVHRTSNLPRIKASECIWKNKAMADLVLKILNGYDYYRWCQQCMGSQNDLMSAGG